MKLFYVTIFLYATVLSSTYSLAADASGRDGKLGWVAAEAFGLTFFPVQGVRGGYFYNKDFSIGGSFAFGNAEVLDYEFSKTVVEVGAKYFLGNSFYVDGNFGMETFEFDTNSIGVDSSIVKLSGDSTSMGLSFHIGNQWQWGGFTLGCDWVGYYLALSNSLSLEKSTQLSASTYATLESDAESSFTGNSMHLTRLYLGWAF